MEDVVLKDTVPFLYGDFLQHDMDNKRYVLLGDVSLLYKLDERKVLINMGLGIRLVRR